MTRKMVDYSSRDSPYRFLRQQGEEYSLGIAKTFRSLRAEIRSYKEDNDKLVKVQERLAMAQEKKAQVGTDEDQFKARREN